MLGARVLLAAGRVGHRLIGFQAAVDLEAEGHDGDYFESERRRAAGFPDGFVVPVELAGRDVLEIGCGFGGMTAWLAGQSPGSVTAVEPDGRRAAFTAAKLGSAARVVVGATEELPLPDGSVDTVVSVSVVEHLHDPYAALREVARVLRPGGCFYARWGPAWLTWNGPHLVKLLGVPWVQLMFTDSAIVGALELLRGRDGIPGSYVEYKIADFRAMGRVTRRKLRRAARTAGLDVVQEESRSRHPAKQALSRLPLLDELLAGELLTVLRRPP